MKSKTNRAYSDPAVAAREIMDLSYAVEPGQDGLLYSERINARFVNELGGWPAEYRAGLDYAIAKCWLWLNENGTFNLRGADLSPLESPHSI
jgi:hypothetical protein